MFQSNSSGIGKRQVPVRQVFSVNFLTSMQVAVRHNFVPQSQQLFAVDSCMPFQTSLVLVHVVLY
jgi:hypothetical protein